MAISWNIATVTNSFAAVSVSGVTMLDVDESPQTWIAYRSPTFYPNLEMIVSDFEFGRMSQGGGGTSLMDVRYTLNYRFVYGPVGSERTAGYLASNTLADVALIINAMLASDNVTGLVDIEGIAIGAMGVLEDPSGALCYGCDMSFRILEFQN